MSLLTPSDCSTAPAGGDFGEQEACLVIVKPDAMSRGLAGAVTSRFEGKGLLLAASRLVNCRPEAVEYLECLQLHYAHHAAKPYFGDILASMTGRLLLQVWVGRHACRLARGLVGATDPVAALPGTIRGDWARDLGRNLVHASDSPETAVAEIGIWGLGDEVVEGLAGVEADPLLHLVARLPRGGDDC